MPRTHLARVRHGRRAARSVRSHRASPGSRVSVRSNHVSDLGELVARGLSPLFRRAASSAIAVAAWVAATAERSVAIRLT